MQRIQRSELKSLPIINYRRQLILDSYLISGLKNLIYAVYLLISRTMQTTILISPYLMVNKPHYIYYTASLFVTACSFRGVITPLRNGRLYACIQSRNKLHFNLLTRSVPYANLSNLMPMNEYGGATPTNQRASTRNDLLKCKGRVPCTLVLVYINIYIISVSRLCACNAPTMNF